MSTTNTVGRMAALALLGSCLTGACGPILVTGGPNRQTYQLPPGDLAGGLRPLVGDEPDAVARLEKVERDRRLSTVFLYSGMAALGGCLLLSNSTINQPRTSDTTFGLIIGTCGLSIALEVMSVIYAPTHGDYGEVLQVYNARRPATAWSSPRLGVDLPPPLPLPAALSTASAPPAR